MSSPDGQPGPLPPRITPASRLHESWPVVVVFAISLALTTVATYAVSEYIRLQNRVQFDSLVEAMENAVSERMRAYNDLLISGRGLMEFSGNVSAAQWNRYVEALDLKPRYPGIQGMGLAAHVTGAQIPGLEARMRAQGVPGFRVHPPGQRPDYFPITLLAPPDARNQAAYGFDMFAEPTRQAAMARARDTGRPATTAKVTLVQEITREKQPGFLLYVPWYDGTPTSVAERRARIRGFIYAPFRAHDLFRATFATLDTAPLDVAVYDGPTPAPEHLLYSDFHGREAAEHPRLQSSVPIELPGHRWTMVVQAPPDFNFGTPERLPSYVFAVGLLMSLLLTSNTWALITSRRRAIVLATHMTSELRQADRAKDEFLSVVTHELRTPLNFIMGFASVLEDEVAGSLNGEQKRFVSKIMSGAERMLMLVNDLLDVAKLQAGKFDLTPLPTRYPPLIEEVVATMRPLASQKRLAIATDIQDPGELVVDGRRVVQVLSNLVSNAIKFTPEGGSVTIRVRDQGDAVLTEVSDTGIGIAEQDLTKLFTRFRQLDMSATRQAGGTGLGLSISKGLIEAHGGRIGVASKLGHGSTFYYVLPKPRG